jgi:hypothetical protein
MICDLRSVTHKNGPYFYFTLF